MDAVEDIKSRLSIEDVVSQYIELKRSGRNFKGLSPFTKEKTPSFMVSPEKQIWHDFSSGKGGDMFTFVMEMEGLDFKGALEMLARQAGVDLSQYQTSSSGAQSRQKEQLYKVLELAAKFYQAHLKKNKSAQVYLIKKRGLNKETLLAFKLGYAPDNENPLVEFLRGKGFKDEEIKRAGLGTTRYRGLGDMFRGRIMIPLMDPVGKVVGFTARQLQDEPNSPKYINTPSTLLYDKSRHVFGLHLAKESIRKNKYAVMVEGNMDVIASYQAGVKQVVATAGTALTEFQLKTLSRLSPDIRLAFDQDEAGLQATERAIPIAGKVGVSLSMVNIPVGKDPDELIKSDVKLWKAAVEQPIYAVDWLIERYQKLLDTKSALGKREFSDKVLKVIANLSDSVEQDHYVIQLGELIKVSPDALRTKLKSLAEPAKMAKKAKKVVQQEVDDNYVEKLKVQNQFLALVLMLPSLREYITPITAEMFMEEEPQKILRFLQANPDFTGEPAKAKELKEVEKTVKILQLLYEELYQDLEVLELRYEAALLQVRLIEQYVKTEKQRLAGQMQTSDEKTIDELLEQAKKLDVLLKRTKK